MPEIPAPMTKMFAMFGVGTDKGCDHFLLLIVGNGGAPLVRMRLVALDAAGRYATEHCLFPMPIQDQLLRLEFNPGVQGTQHPLERGKGGGYRRPGGQQVAPPRIPRAVGVPGGVKQVRITGHPRTTLHSVPVGQGWP